MDLQQQPSEELAQDQALPVGEAVAELGNVHPSEAGLAAPTVQPGDEAVDSKDRLVIGYWRDAIDAEFTVQGLEYTADPLKDVMSERFDRIKLDMVMTRRRRLEESPLFRHPIPYVMIHRHNEAKNQIEFFIFQRSKKVGEQLLAGNHSIGAAGHPEAQSMRFYPNWTLNARDAMVASLIEEMDEELDFSGMTFQELIQNCPTTFSHEGFIRDDANEVGKQHLGLVYSVGIPPHIEVTCKEEELITCGFYTLDEITDPASGFNLERWSYILADAYKRLIENDKAKAAEQAQFDEAEAQRASDARAEAERIAQLPAEVLSLEVANAYLESSDFDLLSWKLQEGESVVEREGQAFFDGFIDHPMEGKKALVIALDPHDPAPDQTIAAIKASVLEGWDALKGDPVGLMDGDLPQEPLDDGNGLELEQEEDGDLPDDLDDKPEFVYPEGFGPVSFKSAAFADKAGFNLESIALPADARFASKEGDLGVYMVTTVDHPEKGVLYVTTNLLVGDANPLLTLEAVKKHALGDSSAVEALSASGHWSVSEELIQKAWGIGEPEPREEILPVTSVERRPDGGLTVNCGRGTVMETVHRPDLDALETRPAYPRGQRPEIAHIDEAPFRHVEPEPQRFDPAPHRDAHVGSDVGGGDSGGSSGDSGSSSSD